MPDTAYGFGNGSRAECVPHISLAAQQHDDVVRTYYELVETVQQVPYGSDLGPLGVRWQRRWPYAE